MSANKGSMQETGKQVSTSTLPPELQGPYSQLISSISGLMGQPTPNTYATQPLSQQYFNTASQQPSQQIGELANNVLGSGNNFIGNQAQAIAGMQNNNLGNMAQTALQAGNNNVLGNSANTLLAGTQPVQNWTDPGVAQQWMNPYTQTALQSQFDLANRQFAQGQAGRNANAIGAGAYGGDRQAIADATAQSQLNQQLQNIAQQGLQSAYQTGQQGFQVQQGLGLEQAGVGANMQGLQNQLAMQAPQVAGQLQALANNYNLAVPTTAAQVQGMQNQYGMSLAGLGSGMLNQQQAINQQALNSLGTAAGTQQGLYEQQQLNPYQMAGMYSGLLGSLPGAQNQTVSQYQKVNPWQNILGMLGNAAQGTGAAAIGLAAANEGGLVAGLPRRMAEGGLVESPALLSLLMHSGVGG